MTAPERDLVTFYHSKRGRLCEATTRIGQRCRCSAKVGDRWCGNHQRKQPQGAD